MNWCVSGRKPWAKSGREQLQQILGNVIGHERNGRLSFSLRQRLRNCAGTVDEKLRDGLIVRFFRVEHRVESARRTRWSTPRNASFSRPP